MSFIRIENNVPNVYVDESRDFQLFCKVYTANWNSSQFYIQSLQDVSDTNKCLDNTLQLLKTRLGFFNRKYISDDDMRVILACFPSLMRNKGSIQCVIDAVTMFTKMRKIKNCDTTVEFSSPFPIGSGSYHGYIDVLNIYTTKYLGKDLTVLEELWRYLIPAGVLVKYLLTNSVSVVSSTYVSNISTIPIAKKNNKYVMDNLSNGVVRPMGVNDSGNTENEYATDPLLDRNISTVDNMTVYSANNDTSGS